MSLLLIISYPLTISNKAVVSVCTIFLSDMTLTLDFVNQFWTSTGFLTPKESVKRKTKENIPIQVLLQLTILLERKTLNCDIV